MAARIDDDFMSAEHDGRVIATARYCEQAIDDGRDVWNVSGLPGRLFTRNQAITAMVLAERLAAGYGDDDPFVIGWRDELAMTDRLIRITTALAVVTVGANLTHGVGHGPVGTLVSAWAALALVCSFELPTMQIRTGRASRMDEAEPEPRYQPAPPLAQDASVELPVAQLRSRPSDRADLTVPRATVSTLFRLLNLRLAGDHDGASQRDAR